MASIPGYTKAVLIKGSTESSSLYVALPGTNITMNIGNAMLDDTTYLSTGDRSRIAGLRDYSLSGSLVFDTSNSGFAKIRAAFLARSKLSVKYLPDGTHGYLGAVVVESFNHSGEVGGMETVEMTLQAAGPLSTA
jgi:predicted secreted protein